MEHHIFRTGHKVALAINSPEYLPFFLKWLNNPEITKHLSMHLPLTSLGEKEYLESLHKKQEHDLSFIVLARSEESSEDWIEIGCMGLHKINKWQGTAETGAFIGEEKFQSGGYGSEAKLLLLRYAFDWLNLRVILSRVHGSNARSVAYSERCGYEIQGVLKQWTWHAGVHEDQILMSVNRERFERVWSFYLENQRAPTRKELRKVLKNKK
jgi:RimJ/RimL family protein N-acetyltransferase